MQLYSFRTRSADCPFELAISLVSGRWKPRILTQLAGGTQRYGDLKAGLEEVSDKVLSAALNDLTRDGLVSRTAFGEVPPRVEYALTAQGESLLDAMQAMRIWAERENRR